MTQKIDTKNLDPRTLDRIIQMAWEDRTTFDAIEEQFGLKEKEVIKLMQGHPMWVPWVPTRDTPTNHFA